MQQHLINLDDIGLNNYTSQELSHKINMARQTIKIIENSLIQKQILSISRYKDESNKFQVERFYYFNNY